ncbi:hypothetical protein [Saccharospirillum salsuginis]|uniref:Uncharacterized protein n=1 Tax=Saccharospirillum salsuginis TaxID=418750 RepID=A0A918KK64_9GAMM|nr:hypothetical protein [Saccharospirillum salsuginis]GGX66685.1 hypothetical protein GCM10007392_38040 [Saccharospirillum salsuginis]
MSTDRYDIYFRGEILDGYFEDFVKADMARLFKTEEHRIEPFFSGQPQPIKLKVDKATAAKYQKALKDIGAKPVIVPAGQPLPEPQAQTTSAPETGAASPSPSGEPSSDWTILPPGSDIGEHRDIQPVAVDTSGFSIAEVGVTLVENAEQPEPVRVDISSLSMGEVGETLVEEDKNPPPPAPDTSHLKLE